MNRRRFIKQVARVLTPTLGLTALGCHGHRHGQVLTENQKDLSGSHKAGTETFKPLIDEALGKLLARHAPQIQPAGTVAPSPTRICFVGVENKSAEELGDFKDQITEVIDNRIVESRVFQPISRRYVEAGLRELRLRPDELFLPARQQQFLAVLRRQGQPFDHLLFARLTSGTTQQNHAYQRDYLLTLELVDINNGTPDKESATIRKGYHRTKFGMHKHN